MSSTTPLHSSSSSNCPVIASATTSQPPETKEPSTKRAPSKERGDSKGETQKRAKLIVSHTHDTKLTMEEKAARVAVVLSPRQKCRYKEGCEKPALERNLGFCGSHCNAFIRKKGTSGHLCLAVEFMPKKGKKLCECESPLCYEIGYPTLGIFAITTKKNVAEDWLKHINASTELRKRSKTNRIRLAYWHFRPEDRDWNGSHWVLKKGALPVANLRLFVESFLQPKSKAPSIRLLPQMHSAANGARRQMPFSSPVSNSTDMENNRTSAASSCPLEMDVLQKRNCDLEAAFRKQEQAELESRVRLKEIESKLQQMEKENQMLKKANEELIQKATEQAGRFSCGK
eukprot:scaffold75905_cov48-Attheya_sp.AAC.4